VAAAAEENVSWPVCGGSNFRFIGGCAPDAAPCAADCAPAKLAENPRSVRAVMAITRLTQAKELPELLLLSNVIAFITFPRALQARSVLNSLRS
jgi:hypothetical protein